MLRFIDVRTACAKVLGFPPNDSRTIDYVNRASERLVEAMKSKGTTQRYRVCVNNSCLVLPRQIETVEAFAICKTPGVVRGAWWEFLSGGPGVQESDDCFSNQLIMGDEVSSFDNVTGTGKKLAIYNDVIESGATTVNLQFWNNSAQWVRSLSGTNYIDGETLTISAVAGTYIYTSAECMPGGFVAAIKSRTNGVIRLYEYTVADGALKPLAVWEPDEEVPRYRSLQIPGMTRLAADGSTCTQQTVIIRGKVRFMPVFNDSDFLQIQSREAIRLGCQAVAKEEKDLLGEAASYWQMAFRVLDAQLAHYNGSGAQQPIQVINAGVPGNTVMNLV